MSSAAAVPKPARSRAAPKQSASVASNDSLDPYSRLSCVLQQNTEALNALESSFQQCKSVHKSILDNATAEISSFKRRRDEAKEELEQETRVKQIRLKQDVDQFGLEAVKEFLTPRKETIISVEELEAMRKRLADLEKRDQADLKLAVETERKQLTQVMEMEKTKMQLTHEKQTASMTEKIESLKQQIASLQDQLKQSEVRLVAANELTKHVSSHPAPTVPTPIYASMGSSNGRN